MKIARTLLATGISFGFLASSPVSADVRCRINLPFGGWTEGCPHIHESPVPLPTQDTPVEPGIALDWEGRSRMKYSPNLLSEECNSSSNPSELYLERVGEAGILFKFYYSGLSGYVTNTLATGWADIDGTSAVGSGKGIDAYRGNIPVSVEVEFDLSAKSAEYVRTNSLTGDRCVIDFTFETFDRSKPQQTIIHETSDPQFPVIAMSPDGATIVLKGKEEESGDIAITGAILTSPEKDSMVVEVDPVSGDVTSLIKDDTVVRIGEDDGQTATIAIKSGDSEIFVQDRIDSNTDSSDQLNWPGKLSSDASPTTRTEKFAQYLDTLSRQISLGAVILKSAEQTTDKAKR